MAVERIIGIDFGTSTSLIRINTYKDRKPLVDKILTQHVEFNNHSTVPTLVFESEDGRFSCGYEAQHPAVKGTIWRNFKLDLMSPEATKREQAEKLTLLFLRYMYQKYESQSSHYPACDTETTYISYPAKWTEAARRFMREAAEKAGFKNVKGVDEPSAAIHTVIVQESENLIQKGLLNEKYTHILIIDMGAGTTDLALCRYVADEGGRIEILSTWPKDMDHSLFGGQEIDRLLCEYLKKYLTANGMTNVKNFEQRYMGGCKSWKESNVSRVLNDNQEVRYCGVIDESVLEMLGISTEFPSFGRRKFEEMAYGYLKQFPELVNECLENAIASGKFSSASEIDLVILTGGHSQWYFAQDILTGEIPYFGEVYIPKIRRDGSKRVILLSSPQETVAYGLVYQRLSAVPEIPIVKPKPESVPKKLVVNQRGNTTGNLARGGHMAKQGEWIYLCGYRHTSSLNKMRPDGRKKTIISDHIVNSLNVINDWLYYTSASNGDSRKQLIKQSTGGSIKIVLDERDCRNVNVIGDWIYYGASSFNNKRYRIYKMRTDGSGREMVSDEVCRNIRVCEDYIYYLKDHIITHPSLHRIDFNGVIGRDLINGCEWYDVPGDGWIYYANSKDDNKLYRMRIDKSVNEKIIDKCIYTFNVSGDWIYYVEPDSLRNLYKMRTDGSSKTQLNQIATYDVYVFEEWIYFSDGLINANLYRMRTDGTDMQRIKLGGKEE